MYTTHNPEFLDSLDEGLTLETSASESLYGGQFTLSTQLIKPNYPVRSPLVGFVFVADKSFVRRRYLKRRLFKVSVPVFQSQPLKIVCTVGL